RVDDRSPAMCVLVNVNSRYVIGHLLFSWGAESMPKLPMQARVAIAAPRNRSLDAHLCAQARTLRIRQSDGLNLSTLHSTSPLPPLSSMPNPFHELARAAGASKTEWKVSPQWQNARCGMRMKRVHKPVMIRSPARRLGARLRPRFEISG